MIDVERLRHDREYWDSVAPEGATHYREESPCPWLRAEPLSYFRCDKDQWVDYGICHWGSVHIADAIPRPASKQWSGPEDGLPPVGLDVEYGKPIHYGNVYPIDRWRDGDALEVLAHVETYSGLLPVVYNRRHKTASTLILSLMRPLKSEKERVVDSVAKLCSDTLVTEHCAKQIAETLYDAGFLKMPEEDQ